MATVTQPTLIPRPWAENGSKEAIPDTTSQFGRASWSAGFPSETAQPLASGGIPPNWLDFQGVLNALSSHAVFAQAGGHYNWTNTVDYPVNAYIVGSNGTLYKSLQESGPGTSAGAKNPTSASSAAYWSAVTDVDAAALADDTTIVVDNSKLAVDLSNVTAAALKKITQYVIETGGGLAMDASTGLLYVDFENMPTDKFNELLKSLKLKIPLTANMTIYVNKTHTNAGDTIIDGRGTSNKPFATIQAAVNYVTSTYALGQYDLIIRVVGATYTENVVLPAYDRTSGTISIRVNGTVVVQAVADSNGTIGWPFNVVGGVWQIRELIAKRIEAPTTQANAVAGCYRVANGAILELYGVAADQSLPVSPAPLGGENYAVRLFEVRDGGILRLKHGDIAGAITAAKPASGTPTVEVFSVTRNGALSFDKSSDSGDTTGEIACVGSCDVFLRMDQGGSSTTNGSGNNISFTGTMTGKRYELTGGSHVAGNLGATFFPGNVSGTVESTTYCWYQ